MAVTRIKNNQITDATVVASAKLVDYSITAAKIANNLTYGSDLTISGNLTVNGQTTTIDTVSTVIEDPVIVLASNQTGTPAVDIGFIGERGDQNNIAFVWDESADEFVTAFTTDLVTNTTVTISSYANFHTNSANVAGNLDVGGNVTFAGNIASLNVTGNISGGNLLTPGLITATGNVSGGNITTAGQVTATGNVTGGNVTTAGITSTGSLTASTTINATGNITGGNVTTAGQVTATGNVSGGNLVSAGDVTTSTVTASGNIAGGNLTTAGQVVATGNVTGGNVSAGSGIISTTGNINGGNVNATAGITAGTTVTATGNVSGGNIATAGQVVATGNVTGGNLTTAGQVAATGNVSGGNITTIGNVVATGNVSGEYILANTAIIGNVEITDLEVGNVTATGFANITGNITGGNISTAGIVSATGNVSGGNITTAGQVAATGNVIAPNIVTTTVTTSSGDLFLNSAGGALQWDGTGNIVMNSQWINNLADPTQAQDAATKQYVDDAVSTGITIHTPVRLEAPVDIGGTYAQGGTTATVTDTVAGNTVVFSSAISPQVNDQYWFSNSFNGVVANTPYFVVSAPNTSAAVLSLTYSGAPVTTITSGSGLTQGVRINSGQGATLTNNGANATLVVDGVTVANADRILVYQQANAVHNGVYVVSEAGNATTAWQLTRSSDMDTYAPDDVNGLDAGDYFYVQSGDTGAGESYVMTAPIGPTIIGYANLTFTQFSASQVYTANTAAGLALNGTVFSAKVDNNTTAFDGGGNIIVKASANLTTPNIGAATGTSLNVTGNVTGGNITTAGLITTTGNVVGGNINTAGKVNTGSLEVSTTANVTGNINGTGAVFSGNVTASTFIGNISGNIDAGGANTNIQFNDGDILAGSAAFTFDKTSNAVTATGNIIGGNLVTSGLTDTGTLSVSSTSSFTGNITSAFNVTGNITGGNLLTPGLISATGNITATGNVTGGNLITAGNVYAPAIINNGAYNTQIELGAASGIIAVTTDGNSTQFLPGGQIRLAGAKTIYGGTLDGSQLVLGTTQTDLVQNRAGNVTVQVGTGGTTTSTWTFTNSGNLLAPGNIDATANVSGANVIGTTSVTGGNIVISGDDITDTNGRVNFNTAGADVDFAVNGDTVANVFYVDAGTGTASFGTSTQTTNALVAFNTSASVLMPVGNTAQRPGTGVTGMLRFNSTTDSLEIYDNSQWTTVGVPSFTVIADEQFNGDGVTVAFTLGSEQTTASCIVSINGVVQLPTVAYSVTGTTLTFTEAPQSGDVIDVRQITTTTTVTAISNSPGTAIIQPNSTLGQTDITGNLIPVANVTFDLGSSTNRWRDGYFSGSSLILGNVVMKNVAGGNSIGFFGPDGTTPATIAASSVDTTTIASGTSSVAVVTSGGNVRTNIAGATVQTISSTGVAITGDLSVTGNATLSGNILGDRIQNGNTQIDIQTQNGNANITVAGTSNVAVFSSGGANITGTLGVTGNITGGNLSGTSIVGTLTTAAQTNITSVGTLGSLAVTGNTSSGNFVGTLNGSGANVTSISATNISAGTLAQARLANAAVTLGSTALTLGATVTTVAGLSSVTSTTFVGALTGAASTAGTVTTAAQPNITSVGTLSSVTVTANVAGGNLTTAGQVVATGNVSGGNLNVTGNIVDSAALEIITGSNGNITLSPNGSGVIVANKDIRNGQANGVGNIGTTGGFFNTIFAKATSAQYADLAEKYTADAEYAPGTVVVFGGEKEVTVSSTDADRAVAGVVSTNPSYIMNAGLEAEFVATVALTGRVPCRVTGTVRKGDLMVSAGYGLARAEQDPRVGTVIGKALENHEGADGVIEVVVGRF